MAHAQRPDWLTELIEIVQRLCAETGGSTSAIASRARKFGRVSRDAEQGAGWFWMGLAGRSADSDQLESGYLAPAEGAEQQRFQLIESVQEGNVLKVRVAEHAPAEGQFAAVTGGAGNTELVANSEAIRIASSARGWSWSRVASAARACLSWAGSAG
jgi:hypothetical protein